MTDKEKAIKALRELCKSSHCVSESLRLSLKPFEVTERKNIIYDYINKPTLDDCIAVVEELKSNEMIMMEIMPSNSKDYYNGRYWGVEDVLTALKELKGE